MNIQLTYVIPRETYKRNKTKILYIKIRRKKKRKNNLFKMKHEEFSMCTMSQAINTYSLIKKEREKQRMKIIKKEKHKIHDGLPVAVCFLRESRSKVVPVVSLSFPYTHFYLFYVQINQSVWRKW